MRKEKQLLLDEIKGKVENHDSFLIMRYENFGANDANEFRRLIGKSGGELEMVRKRVFMKALDSEKFTLEASMLEGHIGIVFTGSDAIDTTKAVMKFGKDHPDTITVTGGCFEEVVYTEEQVKALSKLPSKDEMRAQFLGLLEAPMAQTLAVVDALLTSLLHCLENKVQLESK